MKKTIILIAVTGIVGAALIIYLRQQKRAAYVYKNTSPQYQDEHETMFDYAGWVNHF